MDDMKKRRLEEIFRAGLKAVEPEEAIRRHVQLAGDHLKVGGHSYPLASFKRIIVTGFGKGAAPMAKALEEILGDRLTEGWVTVKYGHGIPLQKVRVMEAGHPIPDESGLKATRFILDRLQGCTEEDLVLCVISKMVAPQSRRSRVVSCFSLNSRGARGAGERALPPPENTHRTRSSSVHPCR